MAGIKVGAPSFTVTVSGNTTYSYYTDPTKGAEKANEKTAENVFDVQSSVSISENILGNSNYKSMLPSVEYSVGGESASGTYSSSSKTHTLENEISGLKWGTHSLTAKVTFDGVSVTSNGHECVITGLPYTKDFTQSNDLTGWDVSGNSKWSSDGFGFRMFYMYFGDKSTSSLFSPTFCPSEQIHVSLSATFIAYSEGGNTKSEKGHLGITTGTTVVEKHNKDLNEESVFPTDPDKQVLNATDIMSNNQRVSISVTPGGWKSPAQRHHIYLPNFSIQYADAQ